MGSGGAPRRFRGTWLSPGPEPIFRPGAVAPGGALVPARRRGVRSSQMSTRVLVVDDEETIRALLVQILEEEAYEPVEAPNAERALALHHERPFPLILTDLYMGKMTGIDLLQQVRKTDADSMLVVMTSNAALETATAALRAGAYDYLLKPCDDSGASA